MPKMLTAREVAQILQLPYETALRFIRCSGIDYIRIGRTYRVSEEKLAAFLQQHGQQKVDIREIR